jgi:hypothetical protein
MFFLVKKEIIYLSLATILNKRSGGREIEI